MKLKEIGEFGFIERVKPLFSDLVQANQMGIGDDCALISANEREDFLFTTDMLMEDVHFLRNAITPEELGYKSLAVNLSDIAAMGGTPVASFLSIAVPSDLDVEYLDAFMNGYRKLSAKYNIPLLGGDTTKSLKHLAINVSVIGKCPKGQACKRNMAKEGDLICVTGYLGDSAGGLQAILNQIDNVYLMRKHNLPEPRIREGIFLAQSGAVHAMMDISDGIASDLKHILKASSVSAKVNVGKLPISQQLKKVSEAQGWNYNELAISGGEDYELLFTIANEQFEALSADYFLTFGREISVIGNIVEGIPEIIWMDENKEVEFKRGEFNHFE